MSCLVASPEDWFSRDEAHFELKGQVSVKDAIFGINKF